MSVSDSESVMSLSPEQADTLKTFRDQLFAEGILHEGDSIGTDNPTLLHAKHEHLMYSSRFLRARRFNLTESKKMVKSCQHWRQTVSGIGMDELNNKIDPFDYPGREQVFKSWSMYFHKTDKKGRPVNIQSFGGLNLPELYKHVTPETLIASIVLSAEALLREVLPAASRAAGRRIEQSFVIVDLKGFGLSQFWQVKSLVQMSFQISQDYYPEIMGQLAIINAPSSFMFIWSIIKPWLSKETVEKVDILGNDYREFLLQLVDADSLPTAFGGNCTCWNAGGCDLSSAGPWMEERVAKKAHIIKEGARSGSSSERDTQTDALSERTPSTSAHVEESATVGTIDEGVVHSDATSEAVTAQPQVS